MRTSRRTLGVAALGLVLHGCIVARAPARAPSQGRRAQLERLQQRRDEARSGRTLSGVGLALGVVASIAGVALLAHGHDVRSMESSADDEDGLAALLAGFLLTGTGVATTLGSGIALGIYAHRSGEADRALDRCWSAGAPTEPQVPSYLHAPPSPAICIGPLGPSLPARTPDARRAVRSWPAP